MITATVLTYKLVHNMDFSQEIENARKIAEYVVKNKTFSSKDVRRIGPKSMIANQILRKYGTKSNQTG
jgi:putative transposase